MPARRARWRAPLTLHIPTRRARWRTSLTLALGRNTQGEGVQLIDETAVHRVEDGRVLVDGLRSKPRQRSAELVQALSLIHI